MGTIASQITSPTIVFPTVYSNAAQRKHQSFASLAFVRGLGGQMPTNAENVSIWWCHHLQKKFTCIITSRAHTQPLIFWNWVTHIWSMSLSNISVHVTCIFVFECLDGCAPGVFNDFYTSDGNVHGPEKRQACDLHVPYGRLDIRQNIMKIHVANMWNSIPEYIKMSPSINAFK